MVEEARDIRDRGFVAVLLLVGIAAIASGLFQMFVQGKYSPVPEFDTALGIFAVLTTIVFVAPYMVPELVGLPTPAIPLATRPYLRYPVPVPEGMMAGPARRSSRSLQAAGYDEDVGVEEPSTAGEFPVPEAPPPRATPRRAPSAVPPLPALASAAAVARMTTAEARAAIDSLEAMATGPAASLAVPPLPSQSMDYARLFRPVIAAEPPPAEYLEEQGAPVSSPPELEPQIRQALQELAGLSAQETNGVHPLKEINGKEPLPTLAALEETLRTLPPGGTPASSATSAPLSRTEAGEVASLAELDRLETDLRTPPSVAQPSPEPAVPSPLATPEERAPVAAAPAAPEVPGGPVAAPAPIALDVPEAPIMEAPSTGQTAGSSPPSPPGTELQAAQAASTPEEALEAMASALSGLLDQMKAPEGPAAPTPQRPGPTEPAREAGSNVPPGPEGTTAPRVPISGDGTPARGTTIEDLSRELAAMRSTLVEPAKKAPLPRPHPEGSQPGKLPPELNGSLATPSPKPKEEAQETNEEELQKVLEEAQSAAQTLRERHEAPARAAKKRKKGNGGSGP